MTTKLKIIVILGPTATGKTKLAIKLAKKFNGEIVGADSRQVYTGMDIGSGKDLNEFKIKTRKGVRHPIGCRTPDLIPYHLIDIVSPKTSFNVVKYQQLAYLAIDDILSRGKLPIVVGGTGLYVSAIVNGTVFPESVINESEFRVIRKKLDKLTLKQLLARLKKIDKKTFEIIDQKNRQRVQRAVEIYHQTGKPKSTQQEKNPKYDCLQVGISPRIDLNERIDKRLEERLKGGAMTKEVKKLHNKKISWKRLESFGLEYRWISLYLQNKVSYHEMKENLAYDIKHFAKRQMTWFKKDKNIFWQSNYSDILKLINNFLSQ